jgi:hypothetical protein
LSFGETEAQWNNNAQLTAGNTQQCIVTTHCNSHDLVRANSIKHNFNISSKQAGKDWLLLKKNEESA